MSKFGAAIKAIPKAAPEVDWDAFYDTSEWGFVNRNTWLRYSQAGGLLTGREASNKYLKYVRDEWESLAQYLVASGCTPQVPGYQPEESFQQWLQQELIQKPHKSWSDRC